MPYQTDHNRLKWICDDFRSFSLAVIALMFDDGQPVATVDMLMLGIEQSVVLWNESLLLSQYSKVLSRECESLSDILLLYLFTSINHCLL